MTLTKILLLLILTTLITFFIDKYPGEQEKFIIHWILISITGAALIFGIPWLYKPKKIVINKLSPIVLATIILVAGFIFYKLFTLGLCLLAHNFDLKACYDLNFSSQNLLSIINKISQLKP